MASTRMVKPAELSESEKAQLSKQERAALADAEKARKRPLSSRAVDVYTEMNPFATAKAKQEQRERAATDMRRREEAYQRAKKQAETPFEARKNVLLRSNTPRKLSAEEMDAPIFRKGGTVRGAGCEIKGKTRGRMR